MSKEHQRIRAIQHDIRRYRAEHPSAADTADGVRRWWLSGIECSREEVAHALASMVAANELYERRLPDGSIVYFCQPPVVP